MSRRSLTQLSLEKREPRRTKAEISSTVKAKRRKSQRNVPVSKRQSMLRSLRLKERQPREKKVFSRPTCVLASPLPEMTRFTQ